MAEKQQQRQIFKSADWNEAADMLNDTPSRLSGIVYFALCAVAIFAVLAYGAVDVWSLGLVASFVGIIAIFWLADAWLTGEFRLSTNPIQIPLLGLIVIGLIQILPVRNPDISKDLLSIPAAQTFSLAPYLTRFAVAQLLVYSIFFALALAFINSQKRLQKTVIVLITFGALMAFFGILQRLANLDGIYGIRQTADAIVFASYINQHHFAALMEMTIGLTLALLFGKSTGKNKRIFLIIAAVIMGMAILFTGSRGGFISLIAVVGFIVAANVLKKTGRSKDSEDDDKTMGFRRKLMYVIGGLTLIVGLFGAVLLLGGDEALLRGINLAPNQADVSSGRNYFWQIALKIISDHPILGTGLDSFGFAFTRYDVWNGNLRVEQAHNDYLQILADAGILGFACIAAFIILLFKQGLRNIAKASDQFRRDVAVGALAGCFGVSIHSFFDFPLRTPANTYIFLILVVLATAAISFPKISRKKNRAD